uniref:uncharacterized protein LOC120344591 n=1 Tax=Styela clava TaxID=7725 RepID=UPI001939C8B7|nr:uncharacterized protein LOC120344591 [Styela clava]
MNTSVFIASWIYFVIINFGCISGGPLACLKRVQSNEKRNHVMKRMRPDYVQMRRCCGSKPYHANTEQCCRNNQTKLICEEWAEWMSWSSCSVTCGSGTRSRYRECINGEGCDDHAEEIVPCDTTPCRSQCQRCPTSSSNADCNNLNNMCRTEEGEGCQSLVRKENNFYFVEKRCKQLKACLIEGRTLAKQNSCNSIGNNSMCMYCCSGELCNKNETTEIPSWYKDSWQDWIYKLDHYATWLKQTKRSTVYLADEEFYHSFRSESNVPLLLRNIPNVPVRYSEFQWRFYGRGINIESEWYRQSWKPDINEVFISSIVEATEIDQSDPRKKATVARTMKNFITTLARHLPSGFEIPRKFWNKWTSLKDR